MNLSLQYGDKVVIKNCVDDRLVNGVVKDVAKNHLRPIVITIDKSKRYTCETIYSGKADDLAIYRILKRAITVAYVVIVDRLDETCNNVGEMLGVIRDTPALSVKTMVVLCRVTHLPRSRHVLYQDYVTMQTLEERAFNAMCKQNGVNAIYEFYFYTKFGGGLMKLLNSENKNKGVRIKDLNGRELCRYETTAE